jgi:hypothetical protein
MQQHERVSYQTQRNSLFSHPRLTKHATSPAVFLVGLGFSFAHNHAGARRCLEHVVYALVVECRAFLVHTGACEH